MLKILLLRSKIDAKKAELAQHDKQGDELRTRKETLQTRRSEIETAISELTEASTKEERDAVEAEVTKYEADAAALTSEETEHETARGSIVREIEELEKELADLEAKQNTPAAEESEKEARSTNDKLGKTEENTPKNTRKDNRIMYKRFRNLSAQERQGVVDAEATKAFLNRCREAMSQQRAIGNVGLVIPEEFLEFVKAELPEKSKLYKHIRVRRIKGNGRAVIMATPVEAYWTELCARLSELDLTFGRVQVTPHKVGAYVPVCNAILEMSDIDLAAEVIDALGDSIGYAYDKAIVYGDGNNMPLGFVTRLIQTAQPADYPADALPWEDLHTKNVTDNVDDVKEVILALGKASSKYTRGNKFWVMNDSTRAALIANYFMAVDGNGRLVSGLYGNADELPVIGGVIETLDFIPDGVIAGGYGDGYLFTESRDWRYSESEHAHFVEDETLFKATSYADGKPAIPQAFAALTLGDLISAGDTVASLANDVVFAGE